VSKTAKVRAQRLAPPHVPSARLILFWPVCRSPFNGPWSY